MPGFIISLITTAREMDSLVPEWTHLFYTSATPNPFAHPLWLTSWARHFISPAQLYLVTLRTNEGVLVGVAPFYRRRQRLGRGLVITRLQLLGAGQHVLLTELPQVLLQPGLERKGLRALMHHLSARAADWDWVEVTLAPEQGWVEPQWLPQDGSGAGSILCHTATRPCVVLPLPSTWEDLRAGLKRNVKESMRRGANRLARQGHAWTVDVPRDRPALATALDELVALHHARATMPGKVRHPDYLSDPADRAFLHDVAPRMFTAGHLSPCLLRVDGRGVAGRLLLHANGVTFFSVSGSDPAWWPYNVGTTLMAECLRCAIRRGDHLANLSLGPDVAKLRWSEHLHLYQDFILIGPRRRSRLALTLVWGIRTAINLQRDHQRFERDHQPSEA